MANINLYRYMVQPGDTIDDLAALCNISANELADLNPQVNPDNLRAGQLMIIPEPQMQADEMQAKELWPVGPWGPWGWGGWGIGRPWGWGWRPWGGFWI